MIDRLELKNFTVFDKLKIDFSSKINVIIGENGTGKTHLLKSTYGLCSGANLFKEKSDLGNKELVAKFDDKLVRLFMPMDSKVGKMHRRGSSEKASISACFNQDQQFAVTFSNRSKLKLVIDRNKFKSYQSRANFIPSKEIFSLIKGFGGKFNNLKTIESIFDDTYIDLSRVLMRKEYNSFEDKINSDPRLNSIIPKLVNLIGGRYKWTENEFCFEVGNYEEKVDPQRSKSKAAQIYQDSTIVKFIPSKGNLYSSSMTAEGFKKIGILYQLLGNRSLNSDINGPLFWDEPESNLNPNLMKSIVEVMLELSRNGQQIILATHDYVLLKWFDLLMDKEKDDHVRYHLLSKDQNSGEVKLESTDDYSLITKSAISNTFAELYDEDVKRALG